MKGLQLTIEPKLVTSVGYDQDEMLRDILQLHIPSGRIDVDMTYGYGGFYNRIERPLHCFDLDPKKPEAMKADSRALPLPDACVKSVMFDPPFVVTNHVGSEEYLMGQKYGGYRTQEEMMEHYGSSIREALRILRPNGILIVKCQDQVSGRRNFSVQRMVMNMAEECGFRWVDVFILIARNRFIGSFKKQSHARKFHSYFLVFRKKRGGAA